MSRGKLTNETHALSHSIGKMHMNTPLARKTLKQGELEEGFFCDDVSGPLSPPPTIDVRQKRERSESLMLCHTNETLATKRRLRSRSRLGLDPEDIASSFMSPPCSSKPRERTHSRSQCQTSNEIHSYYPKASSNHLAINTETNSVFMTPYSSERKPLQSRDLNSTNDRTFEFPGTSRPEQGLLSSHLDYSSDSSSDGESSLCFEDKTRTKLTYDEEAELYGRVHHVDKLVYNNNEKLIGKRIGEKKIDFIKELVNLNCEEICKKIFCYLEPQNLQRIASVSKLWRKICKKDRIASPRLDQFIHGRKQYVMWKGKENLGCHTRFEHKVPQRAPFSVKSNTIWTPEQTRSSSEKDAIDQIKTDIMSIYKKIKCPSCGSPSRKIGDEVCECDNCQEKFCSSCQRRMDKHHKTGKCAIKPNKSKKGRMKEVIGSKQSKSRLKRY